MKRSKLILTILLTLGIAGTTLIYTGSTWLTITRCEAYRSEGLQALEQRRYAAAAEQLGNWMENANCGDDDAEVLHGYAHAKSRLPEPGYRHLVDSVSALRQALAIRPDAASAWRELSLAWAGLGDPARSLAAARKLALLDPDTPETQRLLITALLSSGNHREAHDQANRLLQAEPQRWWLHLARLASERGLQNEPSTTVAAVPSLPPRPHHRLLVQAFEDLLDERYASARERLLAVTETDPDEALFLQTVTRLMLGTGMEGTVLDWLNRQEHKLTGSLRTLYLELAWLSGRNDLITGYLGSRPARLDRAPAEVLIHALANLDTGTADSTAYAPVSLPDSTELPAGQRRWHRLISAVLHAQDDPELVDAGEQVLEIDPRNAVVHQLLAEAWIRLKEPLRAARIAQDAMQLSQGWGRPAVTRVQALLMAGNPSLEQYAEQTAILQAGLERTAVPALQTANRSITDAARSCDAEPVEAARLACWKSLAAQEPEDLNTALLALFDAAAGKDQTFQQQLIDQIRVSTPESSGVWRLAQARLLLSGKTTEKRAAEAALLLRDVLKHSPDQADAHLLMAIAMAYLNDPTSTGAHLNEAVAANPRRAGQALQLVLYLADTFASISPRTILGWWESVTWLELAKLPGARTNNAPQAEPPAAAAQVSGEDALIRRLRILAAFAESRADQPLAELVYRRILQMDQDAHMASNNLAMILYRDSQSLDEALMLADRAVSAMPTNADYQDTRSLVMAARESARLKSRLPR